HEQLIDGYRFTGKNCFSISSPLIPLPGPACRFDNLRVSPVASEFPSGQLEQPLHQCSVRRAVNAVQQLPSPSLRSGAGKPARYLSLAQRYLALAEAFAWKHSAEG